MQMSRFEFQYLTLRIRIQLTFVRHWIFMELDRSPNAPLWSAHRSIAGVIACLREAASARQGSRPTKSLQDKSAIIMILQEVE